MVCGILASCMKDQQFPSPLEGVYIDNQAFSSDAVKQKIETQSALTGVSAKVEDLDTKDVADWLIVTIAQKSITLTLTENISVNDRMASVTLFVPSDADKENPLTVVFYVTQKKNTLFDGLEIDEVVFNAQRRDTLISLGNNLTNVKTDIVYMEGSGRDWLKATVKSGQLSLMVTEHVSKGDRQAMLQLSPNSKNEVADSLMAKTSILVTQKHNPVLDSLVVSPVVFTAESGSQVVHTGRTLTGIRTLVVDDATGQRASWCTAALAGDSITLNATAHSEQNDRSATVTLYLPNNGETIDSTTIAVSFPVRQTHNNIFDGAAFNDRTVKWDQTTDTLKLTRELKGIQCMLTDSATSQVPDWLKATISGKNVVFKVSQLTTVKDRKAKVTLYMPDKSNKYSESAVQTSFYLIQHHCNIFDGASFSDRSVRWDQKADTLKLTRELTGIQCQLVDDATGQSPDWLKGVVSGKNVVFTVSENKVKKDRTATVTLYLPEGGKLDAGSVQTSFKVKQTGINYFSGVSFSDMTLQWDADPIVKELDLDLSRVRSQVIDDATGKTASWLQVSMKNEDKTVTVKPSQLKTKTDRTATVTLYVPNNGTTIDDETDHVSFKVMQKHYDIFDGVTIDGRKVKWDQKADTLIFTRELTGIQCKLVDSATEQKPSWLNVTVSKEKVLFSVQTNNTYAKRSATVTLYLPNGNVMDETTVMTTFHFEQDFERKVKTSVKKIEVDYKQQSYTLTVSSSVDYKLEMPSWVSCSSTPRAGTDVELVLNFSENTTDQVKEDAIRFLSGSEEMATVALKQRTNPHIAINFDDGRKSLSIRKDGAADIQLPVKTLTPGFRISKKSSWIIVGGRSSSGTGQYYQKIEIRKFLGDTFERFDTLMIFNSEDTVYFPVKQHKYVYVSKEQLELDVEETYSLEAKTNTGRTVSWRSSNPKVATVDADGKVRAVGRGKAQIIASIGSYDGEEDYYDYCEVTVYDVTDKVVFTRAAGSYENIGGKVTSQCSVVIANMYHSAIQLTGFRIIDASGTEVAHGQLQLPYQLASGKQVTIGLSQKLEEVSQPQVELTFTYNGKYYTVKKNYSDLATPSASTRAGTRR